MKRLIKHAEIHGVMRVQSGLRIGAGGSSLDIGGLDNPILRHPVTRLPYVPGSSIKGKLRSLLEVSNFRLGQFMEPRATSGPCGCGRCAVCWLFGCGEVRNTTEPTRLIFRDCLLLPKGDHKKQEFGVEELGSLLSEGVFYSEVKAEVTMDRSSGKVGQAGPRSMDRIAAGTLLDFRVTVRVLEGDDEGQMKQALAHALRLLEAEGLGGSVSRGYGQVKFESLQWDGQPWDIRTGETASE
ncbi:MAG: type III-A CRISPR-associated RAMP protein Csm3 [Armatimonadetes bacterium]|nr:type III-A CRISPR-associated RAMP protein Csm3 [Armatimonadota bacterium]NOG92327.1 type III-A CRISPR-associated RAMP protein Csm3 [Armatimonadota bacterium]